MEYIQELINTPIEKQCDVFVAGGGFAGVAAALSAARMGKKVILAEKEYILGGLGTAGLIVIYLPICDGCGHQVSFGLAEELLRRSIKYGYDSEYPKAWLEDGSEEEKRNGQRFFVRFNPHTCAIALEEALLEAGVEILYGTIACAVALENHMHQEDMSTENIKIENKNGGSRIHHVMIENKSGRSAVTVNTVVDATGDADLARLAGVETSVNKSGNPLAAWYYYSDGKQVGLRILGAADRPTDVDGEVNVKTVFTATTTEDLTQMTVQSHKAVLQDMLKRRDANEDYQIVTIPIIPQVRKTRRIVGEYELSDDYSLDYEDSIGMVGDWRRNGPVYQIPFRSLYSGKVKNLITAGRCISVTDDMWEVTRVIPACSVTGQAAGVAAAISDSFDEIDIRRLQGELVKQGVKLK